MSRWRPWATDRWGDRAGHWRQYCGADRLVPCFWLRVKRGQHQSAIGVLLVDYSSLVTLLAPSARFHQLEYADLLDSVINPGSRWLDLGAGDRIHNGYLDPSPRTLATRASLVIGVDVEGSHLRQNDELGHAVVATGVRLPFPACSFDLVTANMVLEHLEDPRSVLLEIRRVLRPGGLFAMVTPNSIHPMIAASRLLLSRTIQRSLATILEGRAQEHVFQTYYRANSVGVITALARRTGLAVRRLETFSSIPFIRRPFVLTALECLLIDLLAFTPLKPYRSNLLGVFEAVVDQGV